MLKHVNPRRGNHPLDSRMQEICQSGLAGGETEKSVLPYPDLYIGPLAQRVSMIKCARIL